MLQREEFCYDRIRIIISRLLDADAVELHVPGCRLTYYIGTNCDQCLSTVQCCFTSTKTVRLIGTDGHLDFHTAPQLSFIFLLSAFYSCNNINNNKSTLVLLHFPFRFYTYHL